MKNITKWEEALKSLIVKLGFYSSSEVDEIVKTNDFGFFYKLGLNPKQTILASYLLSDKQEEILFSY